VRCCVDADRFARQKIPGLTKPLIVAIQADALSQLDTQRAALYKSNDFQEGRKAEAQGRAPVYRGD
jgi:hypothetical protein